MADDLMAPIEKKKEAAIAACKATETQALAAIPQSGAIRFMAAVLPEVGYLIEDHREIIRSKSKICEIKATNSALEEELPILKKKAADARAVYDLQNKANGVNVNVQPERDKYVKPTAPKQ